MNRVPALGSFDPIDADAIGRVAEHSAFDALFEEIVAKALIGPSAALEDALGPIEPLTGPISHYRVVHPVRLGGVAALGLIVLAASIAFTLNTGAELKGPVTTPWRASQPFPRVSNAHLQSGTWRLTDQLLTGTWQQNTAGPPPGSLSCPSASTCYVMSGDYASADAGAPMLSESLYVSDDLGATWSSFPTPSGFVSHGPLSCAGDLDCASGGTYQGQPVLLTTTDGGHSFTMNPYPAADGALYSLSCPTADTCAGLVAGSTSTSGDIGLVLDATLLRTTDGGTSFTDSPIEGGDSMVALDCSTAASNRVAQSRSSAEACQRRNGHSRNGGHQLSQRGSYDRAAVVANRLIGMISAVVVNGSCSSASDCGKTSTARSGRTCCGASTAFAHAANTSPASRQHGSAMQVGIAPDERAAPVAEISANVGSGAPSMRGSPKSWSTVTPCSSSPSSGSSVAARNARTRSAHRTRSDVKIGEVATATPAAHVTSGSRFVWP